MVHRKELENGRHVPLFLILCINQMVDRTTSGRFKCSLFPALQSPFLAVQRRRGDNVETAWLANHSYLTDRHVSNKLIDAGKSAPPIRLGAMKAGEYLMCRDAERGL